MRRAATAAAVLLLAACAGGQGAGERYDLQSRLTGRTLEQVLVRPDGRPAFLLVLLHGRAGSPEHFVGEELEQALAGLGDRAPAVLLPSGGEASYWHDRRDGRWGSYVLREAIPEALDRIGVRQVAVGGFSMGGFGALDLARLAPRRFCAVGAHAPALWRTGGETPAGAFDDAEDFARHDLFGASRGRPRIFGGTPVRIDVGTGDPFRPAAVAFAREAGLPPAEVWPGDHSVARVRARYAKMLRFYAASCAR